MEPVADTDELLRMLAWQIDAGADSVLADMPIDWLADGLKAPGAGFVWPNQTGAQQARGATETSTAVSAPSGASPPASRPTANTVATSAPARVTARAPTAAASTAATTAASTGATSPRFTAIAPDQAVLAARQSARAAPDIAALTRAISNFTGCALKATAKSTCVYRGAPKARIMIIGEAPGRDEDIEGRPFVGRAGQLLDRMLAAIDLQEADVHITNVVYWRPPGNRTPTSEETLACRPFLERQVELVEPDAILLLGGAAAKSVLEIDDGIMRLRGKWREARFGERKIRAMATLHPAYLLRTPAAKRQVWRDLLQLKAIIL